MTLAEALVQAESLLQAGRLAEAEQLCRQIIAAVPNEPEGYRLLGVVACAAGNQSAAEQLFQNCLSLKPDHPCAYDNLSCVYGFQSRWPEAETAARQAIALQPDFVEAHNNLGSTLFHQGRFAEAEAAYRRAIAGRADFADAWSNLGGVLYAQGRLAEARQALEQAIRVAPGAAEPHNTLGNVSRAQGDLDLAERCYRRAIELEPRNAMAYSNLATVLDTRGQFEEAERACRHAIALEPNLAEAANNLGNVLREMGRLEESRQACLEAIRLRPAFPEAENNLGNALQLMGDSPNAEAAYRRAMAINPRYAEAYNNLGALLIRAGRVSDAEEACRAALAIEPNPRRAEALSNLGSALQSQGRLDEARDCFAEALALRPGFATVHSNLLYCEQYRSGVTPARLADLHNEWDRRHAAAFRASWPRHENPRDPDRRLRLGFVSADFARHPVGNFVVRTLEGLDRSQFSIVGYSDRLRPDAITHRIAAACDLWRQTAGLTDQRLAEQVRADQIDILFDLAGHTAGGRLLAFARKPAPLQITWIGYEGTTGVEAIDYLLADPWIVPPEMDPFIPERVLRLPEVYVSYDPPPEAPPPTRLPGSAASFTLASFNNPIKITGEVVATWAEILRRMPQGNLILKFAGLDDARMQQRLHRQFQDLGIEPRRVELSGWSPYEEFLQWYQRVDLALDPFPFGGGLTTCEALWMGVPVLTFPGATFAGRHSYTFLKSIGLEDLVAANRDDYVQRALDLAGRPEQLARWRSDLRLRMQASPLCDGRRLARNLEVMLREVWREWCMKT